MRIDLTDDQTLLAATTRRFLESTMSLARVRALHEQATTPDPGWWRQGADLGWTSMLVSEANGGGSVSGSGLLDLVLIAEEMGRLVSPGPLSPVNLVASAIDAAGSPSQVHAHLPDLLAGRTTATWCWSGADVGPDQAPVRYSIDGDHYVLDGRVTPVEAAVQADVLLVTADGRDGMTQLLVVADAPGVEVEPLESLDLVRRFGEVTFPSARASASDVLGAPGGARQEVERQLRTSLVLQCAELVGVAMRVFEFTLEYAFDRHAFGRPLVAYQALKHRFADMRLGLDSAEAITVRAGEAVARGADDAAEMASVAKSHVGAVVPELIQDCVQMHGGIGVTWEHDIHLYLRRAAVDRAVHGSPSDHRERITRILEERAHVASR